MAGLTELQRSKIRLWLGWARPFDHNSVLESRMQDSYISDTESQLIGEVLTALDAAETAEGELVTDGVHGVKQVDEIILKDGNISDGYTARQDRLISKLESLLSVTRRFRVTSESGRGGSGGLAGFG